MTERDTRITRRQATALAELIHALRPEWDAPGVLAAIGEARDVGPAPMVAIAAIRAATTPTNRTPAVIPMEGAHWRTDPGSPAARFPDPGPDRRCSICSEREDVCRSRWATDHAFESAARARQHKADPIQAKAITDALRAEVAAARTTTTEQEAPHDEPQP